MPQIGDIALAGVPYMVMPGSWKRSSHGPLEGRSGRIVIADFAGGQHRALQLERDASWDAAGVGPALFGQGVEPWPYQATHVDSVLQPVSTAQRLHAVVVGNYAWVGAGRYLYRSVLLTATAWANFTQVADFGVGTVVSGLAYYQGNIAVGLGTTADIKIVNSGTLAVTTLIAGFKGTWLIGYANQVIAADPSAGNEVKLKLQTGATTTISRELDSPITNICLHGGKVAISTKSGLYLLQGRATSGTVWSHEAEPVFSHGSYSDAEDYVFLASYGGRLYTWLDGQVMEWNPNAGSTRQGWRAAGLEGRTCYGGTVAGNMLVVCIQNRAGDYEAWAFDGSGWWLMKTTTNSARIWPAYIAGAGNYDLLLFRNGDATVAYEPVRMVYRDATYNNYASNGAFITSLLDGGERDKVKAWCKIGATFATPHVRGNSASVDAVSVGLAYSTDGGATFTTVAAASPASGATRLIDLEADLASAAVVSRYLPVKAFFTSVTDWAPTLTGLWAEYETIDPAARRRRWQLAAQARDGLVRRDGSVALLSGQQASAALWDAWESGDTLAYQDIDYDADPVTRQVRIAAIAEVAPRPSDAGRWGESAVELTLVEV